MFGAIKDRLKNIAKLNENKILKSVLSDKLLQQEILAKNYQSQLFDKGIDNEGKRVGWYSHKTIEIKKEKGQPYDHITLKDTGAFYASFKFGNYSNYFTIKANTIKGDTDLTYRYTPDILGLTNESIQELLPEIKGDYLAEVRSQIFK